MDWDRIEGNWKQLTGKVKEQWGKLSDDDLATIDGKREQLEGILQERYGIAKDEAKQHMTTGSIRSATDRAADYLFSEGPLRRPCLDAD
jgi:uncharacterized protein YjbJ (UPF0337 family)